MSNEHRVDCGSPGEGDEACVCACEGAETSDRNSEAGAALERPAVVLSSDRFVHRPPPRRRETAVVVSFRARLRKL